MTKNEAEKIALAHLRPESVHWQVIDDQPVILSEQTLRTSYGWICFYTSRKFIETRSFRHRLVGNGPLVVEEATGAVTALKTGLQPPEAIAEFEAKRGFRSP